MPAESMAITKQEDIKDLPKGRKFTYDGYECEKTKKKVYKDLNKLKKWAKLI
jgi:hypothetical protein